jgi:RES domain-containing protein
LRRLFRHGTYYRAFKPEWSDPLDTAFSKRNGGRWNPPGEFGALYLSRTVEVAAANVRRRHLGRAVGLFDLAPGRRPQLLQVDVPRSAVLDVVTEEGVAELRLPESYPFEIRREECWPAARRAHADESLAGVACRSAAECTATTWLGEELAWFDRSHRLRESASRRVFEAWYPDVRPR